MSTLKINLQHKGINGDIHAEWAEWKKKHPQLGFKDSHKEWTTGQVVTFMNGFNNHIEYTTEILGFDEEGKAYMLWDCFWFGIRLEDRIVRYVIAVDTCKLPGRDLAVGIITRTVNDVVEIVDRRMHEDHKVVEKWFKEAVERYGTTLIRLGEDTPSPILKETEEGLMYLKNIINNIKSK